MASAEKKAKRKAEALNELSRLSGLLAEHLNVEVPDVRVTNRDPELAQIQQVEAINGLLLSFLSAGGVEAKPVATEEAQDELEQASAEPAPTIEKAAAKKASKRKARAKK